MYFSTNEKLSPVAVCFGLTPPYWLASKQRLRRMLSLSKDL